MITGLVRHHLGRWPTDHTRLAHASARLLLRRCELPGRLLLPYRLLAQLLAHRLLLLLPQPELRLLLLKLLLSHRLLLSDPLLAQPQLLAQRLLLLP